MSTLEVYAKKLSPKLNVLSRVANAFFSAEFSHCSLIWIFHNRSLNHKISRWHKRCHYIVYGNNDSSYEELLDTDSSFSILQRNS